MAKKNETAEVDLKAYLSKAPTDLQSRFADWLMDEDLVGYDPSQAKTKEAAFREGVRLATAMRMVFQASPENVAANAEKRAAREEPEEAPAKPTKKAAAAPVKKAPKKAAAPVEDEDETEEEPAPAKAKAKKTTAKKRRPATEDDEAPF